MVGLHVVDDEVLDRAVADDATDFAQIRLEEARVHGVHQRHDVVVYQIRVVRNTVGQRPHSFEKVFVTVVHSHVMYFSFNQCFLIHTLIVLFGFIPVMIRGAKIQYFY